MEKIGGIILAGGKSSRMGQDKAMMRIGDKTLIERVYDIINNFTSEIIISSNTDNYDFLKCKIIPDIYKNIGPISGIHASLKNAKYDRNIIISCDTPFVSKYIIAELIKVSDNYDITISRNNEFIEPLIGIYSKNIIDNLEKAISNKNYSITKVIYSSKSNIVEIDKSILEKSRNCFININDNNNYQLAVNSYQLSVNSYPPLQ